VFGLQIGFGVMLIVDPHHAGSLATIGYVLIASLLIGIGRAWELVGEWDTGLFASLRLLVGHPLGPQGAVDRASSANASSVAELSPTTESDR
jgi:hypothetical protein